MDIQHVASEIASNPELDDAARKVGVTPERAKAIIEGVLEHVTSGGDQAGLVQASATHAGTDPSKVQQLLPQVMPLIGRHAQQAPVGTQSELGQVFSAVSGLFGS